MILQIYQAVRVNTPSTESKQAQLPSVAFNTPGAAQQPTVMIVFIENAGRVAGVDLPRWASQLLDWGSEEYGKLAVRLQARRHYRQIVVLEDQRATAGRLLRAMLEAEGVQPVNPM